MGTEDNATLNRQNTDVGEARRLTAAASRPHQDPGDTPRIRILSAAPQNTRLINAQACAHTLDRSHRLFDERIGVS
jgi:hypothetical protein